MTTSHQKPAAIQRGARMLRTALGRRLVKGPKLRQEIPEDVSDTEA